MFNEKFQYALLQYIRNPMRRETLNFGVIVQIQERERCKAVLKADEDFAPKPGFDRENYQGWLEYFRKRIEELEKEGSQDIITSLGEGIRNYHGNYAITEPLGFEAESGTLEEVAEHLYQTYVA